MKFPLIIDCDPGIDDALALFYLLSDKSLEIPFISTVSGNVNIDTTSNNAEFIVESCCRDIPILKGSNKPLFAKPVFAAEVHGENGLAGYPIVVNNEENINSNINFVDEFYNRLKNLKKKANLLILGPMTNIAKVILAYPDFDKYINEIYLMGGGLKGGNTTICAEFNIYVDPEAARVVYNSGIPITMAGLDMTETVNIYIDTIETIKTKNEIGGIIYDIVKLRHNTQNKMNGDLSGHFHDLQAAISVTNPDIFDGEYLFVDVELFGEYTRGMTISDLREDRDEKANVKVLFKANEEKLNNIFLERISNYEN